MQSSIDEFDQLNADVVAVSTDSSAQNAELSERLNLSFTILSDESRQAIDALGLVHPEGNPLDKSDIARPAVFLIDEQGDVRWRTLTNNWRVRVRPQQLIAELEQLG